MFEGRYIFQNIIFGMFSFDANKFLQGGSVAYMWGEKLIFGVPEYKRMTVFCED